MVKGLDVFRAWFADYQDQYVLIGGTAATLAMKEVGLDFRATKACIPLEAKIADDMRRFLAAAVADNAIDPKTLGLGRAALADFLDRIALAYGLKDGKNS